MGSKPDTEGYTSKDIISEAAFTFKSRPAYEFNMSGERKQVFIILPKQPAVLGIDFPTKTGEVYAPRNANYLKVHQLMFDSRSFF